MNNFLAASEILQVPTTLHRMGKYVRMSGDARREQNKNILTHPIIWISRVGDGVLFNYCSDERDSLLSKARCKEYIWKSSLILETKVFPSFSNECNSVERSSIIPPKIKVA